MSYKSHRGFTIVEMMVAITLGMIIVAALTMVFYRTSQSRKEIERTAQQVENGHYAMQLLADDLRHAGYYAEFKPDVLGAPATKPDPCLTTIAELKGAMPLHVQGYDVPTGPAIPSCIGDVRAGTDVVVIRRTSTCVRGSAECEGPVNGTPYFQASLCGSAAELASPTMADWFALDTDEANLTRTQRDCATRADIHRYLTRIYFVANNDAAGDGIPTLKRAELAADSAGTAVFRIVALVEGVENVQVEYGIDTDNDGAPETFTADPDNYACAGAACVTNWRNVMAARINVLVRSLEPSVGYKDTKTYVLGHKADGTDLVYPASGPLGDGYKRHVYQAEVRMNNPAGRRLVR